MLLLNNITHTFFFFLSNSRYEHMIFWHEQFLNYYKFLLSHVQSMLFVDLTKDSPMLKQIQKESSFSHLLISVSCCQNNVFLKKNKQIEAYRPDKSAGYRKTDDKWQNGKQGNFLLRGQPSNPETVAAL